MDAFYQQKEYTLKNATSLFSSKSPYILKIGIELEFYLTNCDDSQVTYLSIINHFISTLPTSKFHIEPEQGIGQIEIKTQDPTSDLLQLCHDIEEIKTIANDLAQQENLKVNFLSRPYAQDCPSSLQFNISLHDENGHNVITSKNEIFQRIISTLLDNTNTMLAVISPKPDDYLRFDIDYNKQIFTSGKYSAPTHLSFGHNNRTCALRYKKVADGYKIEYRVASCGADPYLSLALITYYLATIFDDKSFTRYEETHGNAFDEKYNLKKIEKNNDYLPEILSTILVGNKI